MKSIISDLLEILARVAASAGLAIAIPYLIALVANDFDPDLSGDGGQAFLGFTMFFVGGPVFVATLFLINRFSKE